MKDSTKKRLIIAGLVAVSVIIDFRNQQGALQGTGAGVT